MKCSSCQEEKPETHLERNGQCFDCNNIQGISRYCRQCYVIKDLFVENRVCGNCEYYNNDPTLASELLGEERKPVVPQLQEKITQLEQELTTERESAQQALQTSQE